MMQIREEIKEDNGKVSLQVPDVDRLVSEFAQDVAKYLTRTKSLFFRPDLREVVEVTEIFIQATKQTIPAGFSIIKPSRFITILEKYIEPVFYQWEGKDRGLVKHRRSISSQTANTVLSSPMFQDILPQINRIFTIPIPIMYQNELTFPLTGYDSRFGSWLPIDAPKLNPNMELEKAKQLLEAIYLEFCFKSDFDKINAIAGLLTPFCRGLFTSFSARTPAFFYLGNRERAGKDYCAGITGIVYEGVALEDAPISSSENERSSNVEEARKKILSAFIQGRKRMHFANNKGHIDNAALEALITADKWSDRILGRSELLNFPNELDISLSGNVGVTFTADFANRSRFIRLMLVVEDANSRRFTNPDLHGWIKQNRGLILSALYALVRNWINTGMKAGSIPYTSFPEWARVVGGIMEAAGYENPCAPDKETLFISGDRETADMKVLFELCHSEFGNREVSKSEIINLIKNEEIFTSYNFSEKPSQTKFAITLRKFIGRELSNIFLRVDDSTKRASQQKYSFYMEGASK